MKCIFCKNGMTKPGSAVFVSTSPETVLVVRDVPAEICDNCGEEYFDSETTGRLLEKSVGEADHDIQVEVRRYVVSPTSAMGDAGGNAPYLKAESDDLN